MIPYTEVVVQDTTSAFEASLRSLHSALCTLQTAVKPESEPVRGFGDLGRTHGGFP